MKILNWNGAAQFSCVGFKDYLTHAFTVTWLLVRLVRHFQFHNSPRSPVTLHGLLRCENPISQPEFMAFANPARHLRHSKNGRRALGNFQDGRNHDSRRGEEKRGSRIR